MSWQVNPRIFDEMMSGLEAAAQSIMHAVFGMKNFDIAALKKKPMTGSENLAVMVICQERGHQLIIKITP